MIYCSNCGTRVESEIQFCPNCGIKLELETYKGSNKMDSTKPVKQSLPPKTQVISGNNYANKPKSTRSRTHRGLIAVFVIAGIVIFSGGIGTFVFLESSDIYEQRSYSFDIESNALQMDFDFDISSADVYYTYNSTPMEEAIKIDAIFDFTVKALSSKVLDDVYTISTENYGNSVLFDIDRNSYMNFYFIDNSEILVMLRTDLDYDLSIGTGSGDISAIFPSNTEFGSVYADTGSGNIIMSLEGDNVIENDISLDTGSGSIDFSALSTTINGAFRADTGSGNINIDLSEISIANEMILDTGSGDITFDSAHSAFQSSFNVDTGSGSQTFNFDTIKFGGDLDFSIGSGNFDLMMSEITLLNSVNLNFDGSSGNVDFYLTQSNEFGSLLTGKFDVGSGEIMIILDVDQNSVPAFFEWDQGSGDFNHDITSGNYDLSDESIQIGTYSETAGIDIDLDTGSGDITISA